MLRRTSPVLVVFVALALSSCGGDKSPTAPSPPPLAQIAGAWSGTFESTTYSTEAIRVDLNQNGEDITGTWEMNSGVRAVGNINGTVSQSSFQGTVTYNYAGGSTCSGSFTGTATSTAINWSSPGFATGDCGLTAPGNPLGVRFVLQRR